MNDEWRPNWRDESSYSELKKASNAEIAWEFLRRNSQYAKDWHEHPSNSVDFVSDVMVWESRPADSAFDNYNRLCRKYMLRELYHPSTSGSEIVFFFHPQWQNFAGSSGQSDITITKPSEIIFKFDLDFNIKQQIEDAKQELLFSKKVLIKNKRVERDRNRQILLLRALDGFCSGEVIAELGRVLDADKNNESEAGKRLLTPALETAAYKYQHLAFED